jgi:RNA polymerase sporulation-specific sigma factor
LWDWVGAEFDIEGDEEEINFLRIVIRQALAQLPEEDRYLIERKFWDGATEREIARELGIKQPSVHKRIKRILAKLKEILG